MVAPLCLSKQSPVRATAGGSSNFSIVLCGKTGSTCPAFFLPGISVLKKGEGGIFQQLLWLNP